MIKKNQKKIRKNIIKNVVLTLSGLLISFSFYKNTGVSVVEAEEIGENVTLGYYWQEDTNEDGSADKDDEKQLISWRVLKEYSDGTALVISDKILDSRMFNKEWVDYTWETSDIREWLNTEFYNDAFSEEQKTAIVKTKVVNHDNPKYGTKGGNDTWDNVFLLSYEEATNPEFGFDSDYEARDKARAAIGTDYAIENKLSVYDHGEGKWWLRTPAINANNSCIVYQVGYIYMDLGRYVDFYDVGVRPAMVIDLNSPYVNQAEKEAEKKEADKKAAEEVTELINALPESVKLSDEADIKKAREAYDALTEDQKKLIDEAVLNKLIDAEKALEAAKEADEKDKKDDKKPDKKYSNEWVNGKWYNSDGTQDYKGILSWKQNEKGWWAEDTLGWYPKSMWQKIDGKWYYFDEIGYMDSKGYRDGYWLGDDGAWVEDYYGGHWMQDATGWWYEDSSGWLPVNRWLKIDGKWYYFGENGYMLSNRYVDGWWVDENGVCE